MNNRAPILLVEDNPDDVDLTLRALRKRQVRNEVVVARDGVEALEYLFGRASAAAGPAELPALVLLDLKLPRLDGFEVLRRLRAEEQTRLLQVVILTTSAEERDVRAGYGLGANSYIAKPVDYEQFLDAVGQISAYWLSLNQPAYH